MTCHDLKIAPQFYDAILSGQKRFELRKNDRGFSVGDLIRLKEWSDGKYSGRESVYRIGYILSGYDGLEPDYVILGIDPQ